MRFPWKRPSKRRTMKSDFVRCEKLELLKPKILENFEKCGNFYVGSGFEDIVLMTRFSVRHYE